jgi:MoxR-like ATPase
MTPQALAVYLNNLVGHHFLFSTMIWGPPGIGKSSIVAQTAAAHGLDFIDVRLSQLAPTDLRGLPVPDDARAIARWYPPEFLPTEGQGILFLDELNLAPPAMQGMAQQLVLDRRVGSYSVPEGWFIWAAGNRKEDRAAVFDMPAPLANRFIHLTVEPDFDSFKAYALAHEGHEHIIAFLSFRTELLHKIDPQQPAWPSPRSWMTASTLHRVGMDVAPVIGKPAAEEFAAYLAVYEHLPDLERILAGQGQDIPFPDEPSVRYATTIGLAVRAKDVQATHRSFQWMAHSAPVEWVQLFGVDMMRLARERRQVGQIVALKDQDPQLKQFLDGYLDLIA